jgi:hypothetical protein
MEAVRDPEERERLVYAVRNNSFDRELGQYPEDSNEGWPRLSYLITPATLWVPLLCVSAPRIRAVCSCGAKRA